MVARTSMHVSPARPFVSLFVLSAVLCSWLAPAYRNPSTKKPEDGKVMQIGVDSGAHSLNVRRVKRWQKTSVICSGAECGQDGKINASMVQVARGARRQQVRRSHARRHARKHARRHARRGRQHKVLAPHTEPKAKAMKAGERAWLQAGWIFVFVAFVLVLSAYVKLHNLLAPAPVAEKATDVAELGILPPWLGDAFWGQGGLGKFINVLITTLALLNLYTHTVMSENTYDEHHSYNFFPLDKLEWDIHQVNKYVEIVSLAILSVITVLRLLAVPNHPDWNQYGGAGVLRYMIASTCMLLELFALGWSIYNVVTVLIQEEDNKLVDRNLLWLFLFRSFEMLELGGVAVGIRPLQKTLTEDTQMLTTAFVMALVMWIVMGGMYFIANHDSEIEAAQWEAVTFKGKAWHLFESIPSTMWFVLINLLKEHPLADAHTSFWQRFWVCIGCVVALTLFALPISIVESAIHSQESDEDSRSELQDEEPEEAQEQSVAEWWRFFGQGTATAVISFVSIWSFFNYTARHTTHNLVFKQSWTRVSGKGLAYIDFSASCLFAVEWFSRIFTTEGSYVITTYGFIDLIAWVPGMVYFFRALTVEGTKEHGGELEEWLRAACVLRVFKMERYLLTHRDIAAVFWELKSFLGAAVLICFLTWTVFSELLDITESSNPDPDMLKQYGSLERSLWAELINLHGEFPWVHYTAEGKGLLVVVGFFSIALFCVPITVLSNGFAAKVAEAVDRGEDRHFAQRYPWQRYCQPEERTERRPVYDLLYAHLHKDGKAPGWGFKVFRGSAIFMVAATTIVTVVGTLQESEFDDVSLFGLGKGQLVHVLEIVGWVVDIAGVVFFTVELLLRIVATGCQHIASVVGFCDLFSLAAFVASLVPGFRYLAFHPHYSNEFGKMTLVHIWDDIAVPMRLLRLFSLDSYFTTLNTLKNVLWLERRGLMRAGLAVVSFWYVHATLMYLFERSDNTATAPPGMNDDVGDDLKMKVRYQSVWRGMQYSIVHIFGDFPITDYTTKAKWVLTAGIFVGMSFMGVFIGIFTAGFSLYLREERQQERVAQEMQILHTCTKAVVCLQRTFRTAQARRLGDGRPHSSHSITPQCTVSARSVVLQRTPRGEMVMCFFHAVLIVSLMNTVFGSMPELHDAKQGEWLVLVAEGSFVLEICCTVAFMVEYGFRIAAQPTTICQPMRLLDLVCLFPGIVLIVFSIKDDTMRPQVTNRLEALAVFRAFRIFDFQCLRRHIILIYRAFREVSPNLHVPMYLALNIWITTSSLFMWFENMYKDEEKVCHGLKELRCKAPVNKGCQWDVGLCKGMKHSGNEVGQHEHFTSVPATMYWCSIFLLGEWAVVDFTYAGSRLSIFYVVFGVAAFSIPTGLLCEAMQSAIELDHEQAKMTKKMLEGGGDYPTVDFLNKAPGEDDPGALYLQGQGPGEPDFAHFEEGFDADQST